MKTKLFFLLIFSIFFSLQSQSQLNSSAMLSPDSIKMTLPGKLLSQLIQSAKPGSFTNSFAKEKKSLMKNNGKIKDPVMMGKGIISIIAFLKPEIFKSSFNVNSFLNRASSSATMISSMNLLKDLEAGLKPEALSEVWKLQRGGWLAEINSIK